ncbi:hypothetical protein B7486_11760 [cyanobacterium TDX16]|nr:hypothetical protein B7486_11760 [cyanobacterium TDX16]
MRIIKALAVVAVVAMSTVSAAQADTIMFSDNVALQPTNFMTSVTLPKFDPSLGTLDKITLKLSGHVEGMAQFESLDADPATVDMELAAQIKLQRPDLSTLVITLPLVMTTDNVTAFDGLIDFGGTSGKSYPLLTADDVDSVMTMSMMDLALFTGPGNIMLPVMATGASTGSGAGNLLLQFSTSASANVMVTYDYTVPEPATASLLGMGAFAAVRRRRRVAA